MTLHSITVAGLRTIGQIAISHDLRFHTDQNGLDVAVQLLTTQIPGAPVVDAKGKFIGFISEFDVLTVLESGRDISQLAAKEIMVKDRVAISDSTTISEAAKIMKEKHLLMLPVEKDDLVTGCVTRHDLLRAWVALGLGQEV